MCTEILEKLPEQKKLEYLLDLEDFEEAKKTLIRNLTNASNFQELKDNYKKAALQFHPDKNPEEKELATIIFKAIGDFFTNQKEEFERKDQNPASNIPKNEFERRGIKPLSEEEKQILSTYLKHILSKLFGDKYKDLDINFDIRESRFVKIEFTRNGEIFNLPREDDKNLMDLINFIIFSEGEKSNQNGIGAAEESGLGYKEFGISDLRMGFWLFSDQEEQEMFDIIDLRLKKLQDEFKLIKNLCFANKTQAPISNQIIIVRGRILFDFMFFNLEHRDNFLRMVGIDESSLEMQDQYTTFFADHISEKIRLEYADENPDFLKRLELIREINEKLLLKEDFLLKIQKVRSLISQDQELGSSPHLFLGFFKYKSFSVEQITEFFRLFDIKDDPNHKEQNPKESVFDYILSLFDSLRGELISQLIIAIKPSNETILNFLLDTCLDRRDHFVERIEVIIGVLKQRGLFGPEQKSELERHKLLLGEIIDKIKDPNCIQENQKDRTVLLQGLSVLEDAYKKFEQEKLPEQDPEMVLQQDDPEEFSGDQIIFSKTTPHMYMWFCRGAYCRDRLPLPSGGDFDYYQVLEAQCKLLMKSQTPVYLIYKGSFLDPYQKATMEMLAQKPEFNNLLVLDYDDFVKKCDEEKRLEYLDKYREDLDKSFVGYANRIIMDSNNSNPETDPHSIGYIVDVTRLVLVDNCDIVAKCFQDKYLSNSTKAIFVKEITDGIVYRDFDVTLSPESELRDIRLDPRSDGFFCSTHYDLELIRLNLIRNLPRVDTKLIDKFINQFFQIGQFAKLKLILDKVGSLKPFEGIVSIDDTRLQSLKDSEKKLLVNFLLGCKDIGDPQHIIRFLNLDEKMRVENSLVAVNRACHPLIHQTILSIVDQKKQGYGVYPYQLFESKVSELYRSGYKPGEQSILKSHYGYNVGRDLTWQKNSTKPQYDKKLSDIKKQIHLLRKEKLENIFRNLVSNLFPDTEINFTVLDQSFGIKIQIPNNLFKEEQFLASVLSLLHKKLLGTPKNFGPNIVNWEQLGFLDKFGGDEILGYSSEIQRELRSMFECVELLRSKITSIYKSPIVGHFDGDNLVLENNTTGFENPLVGVSTELQKLDLTNLKINILNHSRCNNINKIEIPLSENANLIQRIIEQFSPQKQQPADNLAGDLWQRGSEKQEPEFGEVPSGLSPNSPSSSSPDNQSASNPQTKLLVTEKWGDWESGMTQEIIKIPGNLVEAASAESLINMTVNLLNPPKTRDCIFFDRNEGSGRGTKLRVVENIYNGNADVKQLLKDVIVFAARKYGIDQRELSEMIDYSAQNGGFNNKFVNYGKEGGYEKNSNNLTKFLRESLSLEDAKEKSERWREFSKLVQDINYEIGIYTGRQEGLGSKITGLRSSFALILVGSEVDLSGQETDFEDRIRQKKSEINRFKANECVCNLAL